MKKFIFIKLLDARHKAHKKRVDYLDNYNFSCANKLGNKIDNLNKIIMKEIDNI